MRILQFNSVGGASGDMILGALVDLGADLDPIREALQALPIDSFSIDSEAASSSGLHGTRITVTAEEGHVHRHLPDIQAILENSTLDRDVVENAMEVFNCIAVAEASVHNTTVEAIHFHEVGAMDSIIDITACVMAIKQLDIDAVAIDSLPVGTGTTRCAHGTMPLPVPATAAILAGFPLISTDEPFELVTPTGAALVSTWKTMDRPPAGASIQSTGHGFGHRELNKRPNLLRACILEMATELEQDVCVVLESNIDDMSSELLGALSDILQQAGALDVFTTPVLMKKQRPGHLLTVLCHPTQQASLEALIFENSTTFGIRHYSVSRNMLERDTISIATAYGDIRIKVGKRDGSILTASPEFDDCKAAAEAHSVAVRKVYEAAQIEFINQHSSGE